MARPWISAVLGLTECSGDPKGRQLTAAELTLGATIQACAKEAPWHGIHACGALCWSDKTHPSNFIRLRNLGHSLCHRLILPQSLCAQAA